MRRFSYWIRLRCCMAFGLTLWAFVVHATETPSCTAIEDPNSVLECVRHRHPEVQRAEGEVAMKTAAILTSRHRPNPEIETRVLFGVGDHPSDVFSETNLFHPFELGGKRGARIRQAGTARELAQTQAIETADQAVLESVLRLHRLRQIRTEMSMLEETLSTYRKTVGLYRGRPLLSPEQETSLLVFDSALQETLLKKTELDNENSQIQSALLNSLGLEAGFSPKWLPVLSPHWPTLHEADLQWQEWTPLRSARAQVENAQASTRLAKSEAWPTVRFGPSLETDTPLGAPETAVGFAFSTALPFYNRHQGKQAEARQEQTLAQLNLRLLEQKARSEAKRLAEEYRKNLSAYRNARSSFHFSKGHEQIEERFERGLIPSTLLLEAHRQMLELTEQTHRVELKSIETLWKIYALEGRIQKERI